MSTKLTKQERLYDETQLAKAIFVERCKTVAFTKLTEFQRQEMINDSFDAAKEFIDGQEEYANAE